jgi:Flp pilus assembly protein TadG
MRDARGASLVEFSLIAPLLIALLFGVIDFGVVLGDRLGVRHGTREAARTVVVGDAADGSCALSVAGSPSAATRGALCAARRAIGVADGSLRVAVTVGTGGYAVGKPIAVCAMRSVGSVTGLYSTLLNGRVATALTVMRIEQTATTAITTTAETPLAGQTWAWCATGAS